MLDDQIINFHNELQEGSRAIEGFALMLGKALEPLAFAYQEFFETFKKVFPYYWRVKTRLPERFHQPCRVLARGKMNSCLVEFCDGYRVVTSRNYVRKWK